MASDTAIPKLSAVLVVNGEEAALSYCKAALTCRGFAVLTAADAAETMLRAVLSPNAAATRAD